MKKNDKLQSYMTKYQFAKGFKRYIVVTLVFIIWMLFFDRYALPKSMALNESIEKLETQKEHFEKEVAIAREQKEELSRNMERYAREKYLMHKDNEDVFVIENKH